MTGELHAARRLTGQSDDGAINDDRGVQAASRAGHRSGEGCVQRLVADVRLPLDDVTAEQTMPPSHQPCGAVGLPRIRRMPSIWAGDSGGAGQHLPQCVVNEPDMLWRCDPHVPCTAAYRSASASYRARSSRFMSMVPRNSQGSASRYGRPQPGHGAPALVHPVRQRCDIATDGIA